jgi:hypothetical protein
LITLILSINQYNNNSKQSTKMEKDTKVSAQSKDTKSGDSKSATTKKGTSDSGNKSTTKSSGSKSK